MNKKNILLIIQLPPPVHGSSIMGSVLIKCLSDIESYNIKSLNSNSSNKIKDIGNFNLYKLLKYSHLFYNILLSLIFKKIDLYYFSITSKGIAFFKDFLIGFFLRISGKKIVYHFHNKGISDNQNNKLYNFCYGFLFKKSYAIILSEHLKYDIIKYFEKEKIFILPNTITNDNLKQKFNLKKTSSVKFLFLSNLIKSKGIRELISACIKLKKQAVDFSLDIIGAEGDISIKDLEALIRNKNLNDNVKVHGKVIGTKKNNFFLNCDVFIHPTKNDCFPLVLLEALKFSKPIISTKIGAIEDMVIDGYNGYIINKCSPTLIAEKMQYFIRNKKSIKQMGLKSGEIFYQKFTLKKFEHKLLQIIDSII